MSTEPLTEQDWRPGAIIRVRENDPATQCIIDNMTSTESNAPWMIDSEGKVEWYLSKLLEIDAKVEAVQANAEAIVTSLTRDREQFAARFQSQVESFVLAKFQENPKGKKTFPFLHGTVALRAVKDELEVDRAAALDAARENHPDLILRDVITTVKESLNTAEYLALATVVTRVDEATGEARAFWKCPVGVTFVPAHEAISIKPGVSGATKKGKANVEKTENE